jgi:hypothetical protein
MARACSAHREDMNSFKGLMRNPEGNKFQDDLNSTGRITLK